MTAIWAPVATLWWREMLRFVRQRGRLVSAIVQPMIFWLMLGGGMSASFRPTAGAGGEAYMEYFFPGIVLMVVLFTAIFATISTVEDRQAGFLQGVLVAPVSRAQIVLGQTLGGATLALAEGLLFLAVAPLAGISLGLTGFVQAVGVLALLSLSLTSLGLIIAWRMDSTQGFHAVMNLLLLPIWFLSGAFFPVDGAPKALSLLMQANPLTYGLAALRHALYTGRPELVSALPPPALCWAVAVAFALATFAGATWTAHRRA